MRQSAPFVSTLLVLILLWAIWRPEGTSFYEYLGWMGSAAAALFAALSARATFETIRETRRAHTAERRPELTLDPGSDYFTLSWPDTTAAGGDQAHPRYNCHWREDDKVKRRPPFLLLENFGGGAALDLSVTFLCIEEEADTPPAIPAHYKAVPYGSSNRLIYEPKNGLLTFRTPGSSFIDRPKRSASTFIPHCGPGIQRPVEIPRQVLWWLALRTFEDATGRGFLSPPIRQTLEITIRSRSAAEGERLDRYRFAVRCAVHPDAVNGTPKAIWEDSASGELTVSFELQPQPRPT